MYAIRTKQSPIRAATQRKGTSSKPNIKKTNQDKVQNPELLKSHPDTRFVPPLHRPFAGQGLVAVPANVDLKLQRAGDAVQTPAVLGLHASGEGVGALAAGPDLGALAAAAADLHAGDV